MERLSKNDVLVLASTSGDASLSDLSGLNLRGVELLGMRFDGSNLKGADLSSANLSGSSFRNADLSGCNLSSSNFTGCSFTKANLERIQNKENTV